MAELVYDIQELVERSGVPRRNIYFYVQQGLLPAPQGAGLAARYGEEHLLRLRLIPQLRREGLRLDQIRERFARMDLTGLRRQLQEPLPVVPLAPAPAAEDNGLKPQVTPQPAGDGLYARYDLPGGMILLVPQPLSAAERLRLEKLLEASGISAK